MGNGGSSFFKGLWDDTIGGLIHGVERLFETGGGSAIYGPAAKPVGPFAPQPKPPSVPSVPVPAGMRASIQLPGQSAQNNSFNTSNQYMARFGAQQHF